MFQFWAAHAICRMRGFFLPIIYSLHRKNYRKIASVRLESQARDYCKWGWSIESGGDQVDKWGRSIIAEVVAIFGLPNFSVPILFLFRSFFSRWGRSTGSGGGQVIASVR